MRHIEEHVDHENELLVPGVWAQAADAWSPEPSGVDMASKAGHRYFADARVLPFQLLPLEVPAFSRWHEGIKIGWPGLVICRAWTCCGPTT